MTVQLSGRLQAIADLVTCRTVLADVGTDHAHLPVWLCETGKIKSAIAMDVREGPLLRAEESIRLAGLEDRIRLRLSDGLEQLRAGEADSIVIAGMGGILIRTILQKCPDRAASAEELILGPQSDPYQVRRQAEVLHFRIDREDFIKEDGKYYPLIHLIPGTEEAAYAEEELFFGPCLLRDRNPVLKEYLVRQLRITGQILEKLKKHSTDSSRRRGDELGKEKRLLEAALNRYEM